MRYSRLLGWSFLFDRIQDNCDIILANDHGTVHILDFVIVMEYGLVFMVFREFQRIFLLLWRRFSAPTYLPEVENIS